MSRIMIGVGIFLLAMSGLFLFESFSESAEGSGLFYLLGRAIGCACLGVLVLIVGILVRVVRRPFRAKKDGKGNNGDSRV